METAIIIAVVTAGNAICFLLGSRRRDARNIAYQPLAEREPPKLFKFNRKKESAPADPMATILENLENYDGTAFGQKDIPKG
jgi:hypothetical protein